MNNIPTPLTLEEIIAQGGIEGSEEAYDDEYGFDYSGPDAAFLYYGGDEFSGGKPFTGVYYELYPNGKLKSYSKYQDGMPIENSFEFYENGKIKTYSYFSKDRLNSYSYSFDEKENLILSSVWKEGKFAQERFDGK